MKKAIKLFLGLGVLLAVGLGIAVTQLVWADYTIASDKSISEVFDGKISVVGSNSEVTVRAGSRVETITVLGNDNIIRIEDGAEVRTVRGGGSRNTIYAPQSLEIDTRLLGEGNKLTSQASSLDGL